MNQVAAGSEALDNQVNHQIEKLFKIEKNRWDRIVSETVLNFLPLFAIYILLPKVYMSEVMLIQIAALVILSSFLLRGFVCGVTFLSIYVEIGKRRD